jgi:hypothetical protein
MTTRAIPRSIKKSPYFLNIHVRKHRGKNLHPGLADKKRLAFPQSCFLNLTRYGIKPESQGMPKGNFLSFLDEPEKKRFY